MHVCVCVCVCGGEGGGGLSKGMERRRCIVQCVSVLYNIM